MTLFIKKEKGGNVLTKIEYIKDEEFKYNEDIKKGLKNIMRFRRVIENKTNKISMSSSITNCKEPAMPN